jgi:hypothetical protein
VLLPFDVDGLRAALEQTLAGRARMRSVTLAEAMLQDGQRLLAFNDLFIGAATHVSARYRIGYGERRENQSSSGIIVSTGAGSTGWLSSIFNETAGILAFLGGGAVKAVRMEWEEERLLFVVREPFASRHSQASMIAGEIRPGAPLLVESQMPAGGVIFSDGIEADHLDFNSGAMAEIGVAAQKANLVVE